MDSHDWTEEEKVKDCDKRRKIGDRNSKINMKYILINLASATLVQIRMFAIQHQVKQITHILYALDCTLIFMQKGITIRISNVENFIERKTLSLR